MLNFSTHSFPHGRRAAAPFTALALCAALGLGSAACAQTAPSTAALGVGPSPVLPAPEKSLIPTVNIAPAIGWPDGATPQAMAGLNVVAFANALARAADAASNRLIERISERMASMNEVNT